MQVKDAKIILLARKKVYIIFCVLWSIPLTISMLVLYKDVLEWQLAALSILILIIFFCWLRFFKIELSAEGISYRTLWNFVQAKSLTFSEISKAEIKIGIFKYTDRFKPTVRLELYPNNTINKPPIVINMKVFSEKDLGTIFDILESKGIVVPKYGRRGRKRKFPEKKGGDL